MKQLTIVLAMLVACFASGCGSDEENEPSGDTVNPFGSDDTTTGTDATAMDTTDEDTAVEPPPMEDFWLVYGYEGRVPSTQGTYDLWLSSSMGGDPLADDPSTGEPTNLTTFTEAGIGMTCEFGCVVNEELTWIAVATSTPTELGYTFQVGQITPSMEVKLVKGGVMADKIHFVFAADKLFMSEKVGCEQASCQYAVKMVDLMGNVNEPVTLATFPPDDDPDWLNGYSNYTGYFYVSPDGESVIALTTTIRSTRVYIWKNGTVHELDFICKEMVGGVCSGTGSEYRDDDPVAISPDSRYVAFFTTADGQFLLRLYDTENYASKKYSVLMQTPTPEYATNACYNKDDWQYTEIAGLPRFTNDSKHIMFIGSHSCNTESKKPCTNLLKVATSDIGSGMPLTEAQLVKLTDNPCDGSVEDVAFSAFALSPSEEWVTFAGTPMYQESGALIPEGSSRQISDQEVWLVDLETLSMTQLTNSVSYEATNVIAVPRKGQ